MAHDDFSGIWRSRYEYLSSSRNDTFTAEHIVKILKDGEVLVIESLPDINKSYAVVRLWLDGNIATGAWQEHTSPEGHYKGATYHGAIQAVISKDRKHIAGKWVGFGKNMEVKTGPWEFTYLGKNLSVVHDKPSGQ
jgi:hypothetical protein